MKCRVCGTDVTAEATFCHKCGDRLAPSPAASPDRPRPPPAPPSPPSVDEARPRRVRSGTGGPRGPMPEQELWEGHYSAKAMIGTWILAVIISLAILVGSFLLGPAGVLIGLGVIVLKWLSLLGLYLYRRFGISYRLTSHRLVHRRGILVRVTDRIDIIDIDDVVFEQGIIERFLSVGTIRVLSSDHTHPELVMRGIDDVAKVSALIDHANRSERERRGMFIEAV
jgi:membrane protein YdbS with pleckstrin-like domain